MKPERKICVFSLSKRDIFINMEFAIDWLKNLDQHPFYFREKKPKNGLPPGSIVLFSFKARIIGQAVVKKDVQKVSLEKQKQLKKETGFDYKYYMILNPINRNYGIFRDPPRKKDLEPIICKNFARLFTYLDWTQYQQILEAAGCRPIQ